MTMAAAGTNAQSAHLGALRVAFIVIRGPAMNAALRVTVLLAAGVCAMFWFVTARASIADALPLAKGMRFGLWTTLVLLLAVLPALVLAICNVAVRRAAALAALAAAIYIYMFIA